jgi:hypothetical protein
VRRKDWCWSIRLVYDPKELPGVIIIRPGVAGVLQLVLDPTLTISWACMCQLRRL